MSEDPKFLSEFVCTACAHTGHAIWEGAGAGKRLVESSALVKRQSGDKAVFACAHCGSTLSTN